MINLILLLLGLVLLNVGFTDDINLFIGLTCYISPLICPPKVPAFRMRTAGVLPQSVTSEATSTLHDLHKLVNLFESRST